MMTGNSESKVLSAMPVVERDHARGEVSAAVTLIEYGDYECMHCQTAATVVQRLQQQLGTEELLFIFRHFPLYQIHHSAFRAAEAAEAAGEQGKFWEMHDLLYERRESLDDSELVGFAAETGLDVPQFLRALTERTFAGRVREDLATGLASGVSGTPAFFINGEPHRAAWDFDILRDAVRRASVR